MSSTSVAAVLKPRGLSPAERVILWAFAEVSDDAGYSWRSIDTVAVLAELDERHVRRLVIGLRKRAYLDQTYQGGGRGRPALYRVLPTVLIDDPDAKSRARYEERFRAAEEKGGNMSPFRLSGNTGAGARNGGSPRAPKGGPETPRLRKETKTMGDVESRADLDVEEVADLIPREEGEEIRAYFDRAHKIRAKAATSD